MNMERDKLVEELRSLKTHHQGVTSEQEHLLSQVGVAVMMLYMMTSLLHRLMK